MKPDQLLTRGQVRDIIAEDGDVDFSRLPLFEKAAIMISRGECSLEEAATGVYLLQSDAEFATWNDLYEVAKEATAEKSFDDLKEEITTSYTTGAADQNTVKVSNVGRARVYDIDDERWNRARNAKRKRERFSKYVGDDDTGKAIRDYARKNPGRSILLRSDKTGAYTLLKRGSKEVF